MRLIRPLRDCKQRSLTVSKKAPTVSKKASPNHNSFRDDGKGGLSLRGVAVMTKTATTAETARTVKTATVTSRHCIL